MWKVCLVTNWELQITFSQLYFKDCKKVNKYLGLHQIIFLRASYFELCMEKLEIDRTWSLIDRLKRFKQLN